MYSKSFNNFDDQIIDLPSGKLATLKTYLKMSLKSGLTDCPLPGGFTFERLNGSDLCRYRTIFTKVGQNWLWFSRLLLDDSQLAQLLNNPLCHAHALVYKGHSIGLFEIHHQTSETENASKTSDLAFLGLDMPMRGQGLGRILVQKAKYLAQIHGSETLTVNTCQLDDPRALGFYQKMGFKIEKLALEILNDPRHLGLYPPESAPHIALSPTKNLY